MAIVDVYDALISRRPYKEAMSVSVAQKIMQESSGTHFDPILIDLFMEVKDEIDAATREYIRPNERSEHAHATEYACEKLAS
jgi:putative two-component system response regulator